MGNIYNHNSIESYFNSIKSQLNLKQIAQVIGCSYQKVHFATREKYYWIYPDVRKWRKALGLSRADGDYFELLALVAAYMASSDANRQKMLERILFLADRLEAVINPAQEISNSLIYWIDPFISVLRNLTDLDEFPSDESEIPQWVSENLIIVGVMRKIPKKKLPMRIERSWNWLKGIKGVAFYEEENRWEKTSPLIISKGKLKGNLENIQSTITAIEHMRALADLTLEVGNKSIVGNMVSTFSLPKEHLYVLNELIRDFVVEITRNLNFACNSEFLEELREFDEDYYNKVIDFKKKLEAKNIKMEPTNCSAPHTLVQLLVASRKLIK